MNKLKKKTLLLTLALSVGLLLPLTMNAQYAQYNEHKFGLQPWCETSLLGREGPRGGSGGYSVSTEQFGSGSNGGYIIGTEQFGQNAPLGSGLFIMAAAGAAYAFSKRKKNK